LLRNALLSMALSRDKRGLRSLASVREYLERVNVEFSSDSQLCDIMRELGFPLRK
jgi:hypothetical protein